MSGYNNGQNITVPLLHNIGYLPQIVASPTSLNVVYTLMKRSILISDYIHGTDETDMDKPSVTIVVDQALYTKVRASSGDPDLERIVLPMGAMPSMLLLHILL